MGENSTLSGMCCFPWKCSIYRRINLPYWDYSFVEYSLVDSSYSLVGPCWSLVELTLADSSCSLVELALAVTCSLAEMTLAVTCSVVDLILTSLAVQPCSSAEPYCSLVGWVHWTVA